MNFSAAQLVKCSASQLVYFGINKDTKPEVTKMQYEGDSYAKEIVDREKALSEKRGVIEILKDSKIYFCVDFVKGNKFVEIKMVKDNKYEEWYLKSSLLQATFYASMLKLVDTLDTPDFLTKLGVENEIITVPDNFEFELWFGKIKYKVFPNNDILNFYKEKAERVLYCIENQDFASAKRFDTTYKYREFDIYKPYCELI